jgi:N-glycosylase/DNA lyase
MAPRKEREPITVESIVDAHRQRADEIRARLDEFAAILKQGDDVVLFEEMVFCFFTGGCSAVMGIRSLDAIKSILLTADREQFANALAGRHRYPNARARYVAESRDFLQSELGLRLREKLSSFEDALDRRDWLVREKGIKGLGYKEASHYLRNIGYKGYAILDKHVLNCLAELKIIDDPKPPNTRTKYLRVEVQLKQLAALTGIDFDELDLVLWSMKTGVILK